MCKRKFQVLCFLAYPIQSHEERAMEPGNNKAHEVTRAVKRYISFLYIYSPQIQCKQNFCFRSIHSQDDNILAILCLGRFWKSRKTLVKKSNNSSLNMCFFRCFIPEFGFQSCIPGVDQGQKYS